MRCRPGFAMQAKVSCEGGEFRVPGGCLPEGATPRKTRAVQLVMALSGVDMAWAEANRGAPHIVCMSWESLEASSGPCRYRLDGYGANGDARIAD